jgi:hypothetical protein
MTEDTAPLTKAEKTENAVAVFCSKSGYKPEDVLTNNPRLRTFVTSNGGKYQLLKNGSIRILKGPDYPKMTTE